MIKRGLITNKRGSGHIEMIFSFVFFAGFIFFLFLLLKPYDTKSMLDSLNRGFADSFEKNTSIEFTTFFLKANYSNFGGDSCFSINLSEEKILSGTSFSNSLVKNISNNKINSSLNSNGILDINRTSMEDEEYFKIFISPEFETGTLGGCSLLDDYKIGGVLSEKVLSYNSLVNLNKSYSDNYESTKEGLGIPRVYDFAIISKDLPEINMDIARNIQLSVEIFARNYYFRVLNSDGEIINAEFTLKVW